jgi:MurNAc alpha-1-phosphate uridylyltransferase
MKGMIFAAGLGSRLKPWTDHHPKALAIVNGKSLLQRNVEYLQQYGVDQLIINVHHFADQIIDTVQKNKGWGTDITISDETDQVLETGGGLKKARWYFEDTKDFVVMNADILTHLDLTAMIAHHRRSQALATLAVTERETSRYFLFDEQQLLAGWRNVKTGEERISRHVQPVFQKAFSGIHVINNELLGLIKQEGKFSMVDVYLELAATHPISSFDHTGTALVDVGKPENIQKAESLFP